MEKIVEFQELYERYRVHGPHNIPNRWTNFLGLSTDCSLFPQADKYSGQSLLEAPVPCDGVYGTTTEYQAVLEAIYLAEKTGRKTFRMVELGAGWGPWISAAGLVCQRQSFELIELAGIEADPAKYEAMQNHFSMNGLLHNDRVNSKLMFGAAWDQDTTLRFPKIGAQDMGGAASETDVESRGFATEMIDIPAYCLETICGHMDTIDVMHWDVQGAEDRIAINSKSFLDEHVRSLQIGTHSRVIEGNLITLFIDMGWDIIREVPCQMKFRKDSPTLEGMTTRDGELYVQNPMLL